MPCSNPLQGILVPCIKKTGEFGRSFTPIPELRERFRKGLPLSDKVVGAPCRKCLQCRLEMSREKALRATHEARMFENNCFITLTFNERSLHDHMPCVDGLFSLDRKIIQDFIKRLRHAFSPSLLRVFGCGEYGEACAVCRKSRRACNCIRYVQDLGRPHYHLCVFNCSFLDRKLIGSKDKFRYYSSEKLSKLWRFGFSMVCDFSFETAAYVARYNLKKINGVNAEKHYKGRLPEFPIYPTRGGGLGKPWFEKFGKSDVFPTDSCLARNVKCGVPAYYDRLRDRIDPEGLAKAKLLRSQNAKKRLEDNTFARLQDKERCVASKIKSLIRRLENE